MKTTTIIVLLLIMAACAPSPQAIETAMVQTQAAYTPTPKPTAIPPSITPDLLSPFLKQYTSHLVEWSDSFKAFQTANKRIALEGTEILNDDNFQKELGSALGGLEKAAKELSLVEIPDPSWQSYHTKAEELHAQTQMFTTMYLLSLTGDQDSLQTAIDAMNKSGDIYIEIVNDLDKATSSLP